MEKRDILLNMRGMYGAGDEDSSTLEFYAEGTLCTKDGAYIIECFHNDSVGSGQEIKLIADGDEIRMQCRGEVETDFLFSKNQCFLTACPTSEGLAEVTIFPHCVTSSLSREKGTIDLDYTFRMGNISTHNRLTIDYRLKNTPFV